MGTVQDGCVNILHIIVNNTVRVHSPALQMMYIFETLLGLACFSANVEKR